ncbi:putative type VI secretion system effector [Herbaspirillum seropedicae]|uniref:putative type VI secretion system effector n=1 Tax=Herbaspirillum seropedicae TaxID=964 RepID=UPI003D95B000
MAKLISNKKSPGDFGLVKISGRIKNYRQSREEGSFVLTRNDRRTMGIVSVALATAGLGGQAMVGAANASHIEEEADYVRFEVDDQTMEGWLWRSPFKDGDDVEVAAVPQGENRYEIVGMTKPSESLVALYPHCVRGKAAFYWLAIKWWLIMTFGVATIGLNVICWLIGGVNDIFGEIFKIAWLGAAGMFCFVIFMLMLQWIPFVRTAQHVFNVFGWENASSIDLVKTTRRQRKPGDPPELGVYYFKY